jgi:hypothetical protein
LSLRLSKSTGAVRFSDISCRNTDREEIWSFRSGETIRLQLEFEVFKTVPNLGIYLSFTSSLSYELVTSMTRVISESSVREGEKRKVTIEFPQIPLRTGDYFLTLVLGNHDCTKHYDYIDHQHHLPTLSISPSESSHIMSEGYFDIETKLVRA